MGQSKLILQVGFLSVSLILACSPHVAFARRVQECGVENYKALRDAACGVELYRAARTDACGVELYNSRQEKKCPGYLFFDEYWTQASIPTESCQVGYGVAETKMVRVLIDNDSQNATRFSRSVAIYRCVRDEAIQSCRLPEFGAESYSECRHANHGPEVFQECRLEAFGVESYQDCDIQMTTTELDQFIAETENIALNIAGPNLINQKGRYLGIEGGEVALACTLRRFEGEIFNQYLVDDLKSVVFPAVTGRPYNPDTSYDCTSAGRGVLPIEQVSCEASNSSAKCEAVRKYNTTFSWLQTRRAKAETLKNDFLPQRIESYRNRLGALALELQSEIDVVTHFGE